MLKFALFTEATQLVNEIFILTPGPIERPGGMERFLQYLASGFQERGYVVRVFHVENTVPEQWRHPDHKNKIKRLLADVMCGIYIGRAARTALHPGVRLVLSNSTVGWYPLTRGVKRAHFFHGTYRGQAEAIRPFIRYVGFLKLKWWDAMIFERLSGKNKIALCCSEQIRGEIDQYFGYPATVMWYPIDLKHFRELDMSSCRRQLGLADGPLGLFVGSASPVKGLSVIEHIARRLPEMTMLVALRGPIPEMLRKLPNVRIYQNANYDLLPILYNAADFSLCPSRYDSFPFVVSEALACGTPVICSPHGASLTYYDNTALKQLLTASTDDLEGFEKAVRMVLSDSEGWRNLIRTILRPKLEERMAPENWWKRFLDTIEI
jgi:glycosyltransferase involved in cell wall biosynthesis